MHRRRTQRTPSELLETAGESTDVDSWSIIMKLRLVLEHLYA
jgi:hypothetical protein